MEEEIWKDIYYYNEPKKEWVDYRGLYQVSNLGRVRSLDRTGKNSKYGVRIYKGKIIKPCFIKGYLNISLSNNGIVKKYFIHHLVARMFIPNYIQGFEINHKDEDKTNNKIENLEWISHIDNCNWGTRNERIIKKIRNHKSMSKSVLQFDKNGNFIKEWISINEAARFTNMSAGAIVGCCKGRRKTHKGFIWKYKEKEAI